LVNVRRKADQGVVAEYRYDAEGRRRMKVVHDPDAPGMAPRTTRFLYDGWRGCEDQDGAGQTLVTYVGSPEQLDAVVQMRRTALHPLGPGDYYFHQNIRYDVVAVTDAAGAVVERRVYDDYGRAYGADKEPAGGSAVGNPFGFQGARLDAETGLYYFRHRYYDPETGRFLQRDPVTDPGNVGNSYTFAWNSPAAVMDPMGWCGALLKSAWRLGNMKTSDKFDFVYGAVDATVDTYGRSGTAAGSTDLAEGGLAVTKIVSNSAGLAASGAAVVLAWWLDLHWLIQYQESHEPIKAMVEANKLARA
jgi:RHS repeat-associated protein